MEPMFPTLSGGRLSTASPGEVLGQGIYLFISNKFLGNAYDDVGKILEIDMS